MNKNRKVHYAWWILVALCIIVGIGKGGLNNSAGLFLTSVTEDLGIGMGNLSLYFSVSAVVTMIFLPIGGKLMAKYDTRLILSVGIVLQAGAFALFGLMSSVWGWYILAIPLAVGGVFITVIAGPVIINQWFKKRNGLALGILSAVGGAVGAGLIANFGWRTAYIAFGLAAIIIVVPIVLLLIKRSPQAHGVQPYGAEDIQDEQQNAEGGDEAGIDVAIAKKSMALYALIIFFFFITSIASFSMHIPTYLVDKGFDITFAGNIMGTYMIGILIGSLILGFLIDKLGSKYTSVFAMVAGIIAISLLLFASDSTAIITFAVGLFGLISSSIGIIAPALTSSLFGQKAYSEIYSTASLGLAISSIVALPVYGFIFDLTGSYTIVLYAIIAMLIINIVFVFMAFTSKRKLVQQGYWTE